MTWLIVGCIVLGIVIISAVWLVSVYNAFVKLRNMVEESFSTMDVYLKKRYDLIPNLVSTVKGYAKHESGTLEKVIAARNMAMGSQKAEERAKNENILSGTLKSLFAVTENYPDLKADKNFMDLQQTLKSLEMEIANSRKYYNGVVREYNTKRESFPSNIIAKIFKFEKKPLFVVDAEEERKNVKVEF